MTFIVLFLAIVFIIIARGRERDLDRGLDGSRARERDQAIGHIR